MNKDGNVLERIEQEVWIQPHSQHFKFRFFQTGLELGFFQCQLGRRSLPFLQLCLVANNASAHDAGPEEAHMNQQLAWLEGREIRVRGGDKYSPHLADDIEEHDRRQRERNVQRKPLLQSKCQWRKRDPCVIAGEKYQPITKKLTKVSTRPGVRIEARERQAPRNGSDREQQ